MSVVKNAEKEMRLAKWEEDDIQAMLKILNIFFSQWDSGGAVWAMAPMLQTLLANKCLTPLTGEPDEWTEVADKVFQNKRVGSVFKDPRFHDGKLAYDLDNPKGARVAIQFPYTPTSNIVISPVVTI